VTAPYAHAVRSNAPCHIALTPDCRGYGSRCDGDVRADGQPSLAFIRLPVPGVPLCMLCLGRDGIRGIQLTLPPAIGSPVMTNLSISNDQPAPLPRMRTVAEVATMFGRAPRTIRGWIARGLLKATKIGNSVFISPAQIDALVAMPEPSDPASFEA
jgi:hypothetical protein